MRLLGKEVTLYTEPGPLDEQEVSWHGADLWRLLGGYFGYLVLFGVLLALFGVAKDPKNMSGATILGEAFAVGSLFLSHARHRFWPDRTYWRLQWVHFRQHLRQGVLWGIGSHLGAWVVAMLCAVVAAAFGGDLSAMQGNNPLDGTPIGIWWVLTAITIVVIAPLTEELFMRGMLFGWLRKKYGVRVGLLVSALIFGAAHFNLLLLPGLVCSGLIFGLLYERTGSLAPSMVAHATHNLISVGLALLISL